MVGYVIGSVVSLLGLMIGGVEYLKQKDIIIALIYLMPFILVSAPIFTYLGLTQETIHHYGMKKKRAWAYTLASEVVLLGAMVAGIAYIQEQKPFVILLAFTPFIIGSTAAFVYLGLTEKNRSKMDAAWERQWVEYYSDPQAVMLRGSISGALWILTIAAFVFGGFMWSWKYSWITFVIAIVCEIILEAVFALRKKK